MTLMDFFRLTRHNLLLLVGAALAGLVVGALVSLTQPTVFSATANGYVVAGNSDATIGSASTALDLAERKGQSYVPLVGSKNVIDGVQKKLETKYAGLRILGLAGLGVEGTNVFRVTALAPTAEQAKDIADEALVQTAAEALRLESMTADGTSNGRSVVRLVPTEAAAVPTRPVSPTWLVNLAAGLAGGVVLGYAVSFVRRSIDGRIRTQDDVDEVTGSSVLGILPREESLAKERGTSEVLDSGPTAESLRTLRTNLQFVSVDDPPRTIVMTSANPGEGKSTVAANLARVLAQAGQHVVLVDADLRRPTQARRFKVDSAVGLTAVLAGSLPLADALQPTSTPRLTLLPAGRIPPNPSELVGSRRMRQVLDALRQDHVVIIDAPPLLPVTDAGLLSAASDGAILVLRVGKTQKEQVRQVMRLLKNVNGRLLGSVLNMTPRRAMGTAMYGYGYGGYGTGYESDYVSDKGPARAIAADGPL